MMTSASKTCNNPVEITSLLRSLKQHVEKRRPCGGQSNLGRNSLGFQPKSSIAGAESKIISFAMRFPIATFAFGTNGLANENAARYSAGGIGMMRRGLCNPSKIRPTISR